YLEQHPVELSDLHCVSVTGEALSLELAHRFFRSLDGIKLANAYGLTETSDDTNHEVMTEAPYGTVPLGPSVNNVYVYVVDEFLAPVPLGAPGEIVFSGICVGRGYINDPDRTAQAYLADPIRPGERLYRSGDFGRWRPDGKLEYLGRRDAQVKIRGFRIEIGEIENTLLTRDGVRQAAVVVTDKSDGEQHLVAFHSGAHCSAADLQDHLGRSLPEYMVPTVFHWMESLPLTDNGKINKKALRALAAELDSPVDDYEPLSTDTERRLAEIWSGILAVPVDEIGRRDNFFDRGGSSLSAVELVVALDGAVTLKDVTGTPVLADLACVLDGDEATSDSLLQRLSDSDDGRNGVLVCMPYAGGNAINFRALAQALSGSGLAVHAVELPGHDMGENDDDFVPLGEVADRVAAEVAALSERPVALWGHSAGTALALEVARRLGNKGVELAAVFVAAQMPGDVALRRSFLDDLSAMSDRKMATSLLEATGYAEIEHLDAGQLGQLGAAYRHDVSNASRFFINELESSAAEPMATPLIVVSAAGDDATADASSRLGEWERFAETVRLIQLERGGHFFIRTEPSLAAGVVRQVMLGEDVAAEASEPES
ncbi:MAG: alpha/beta fold hydrolase, partial [Acidimicrobiales bacterium]|nr:alpha/beta fold hydrolase [Acidimicrobiales bacterium]